jgi:UDP-2,3-diacylglucosamine hydrolase
MPDALFISDLHLAPDRSATVDLFLGFLRRRAQEARALYILGDLFDTWIGDDDNQPPNPEIRAALRDLTASGTSCCLMHGNRDFLIGRAFARDTGCMLLQDPALIDLAGTRTLLMHGDILCTDDLPYHRYRRRIRNPVVKRLFLWKSLARRRAIAADFRTKSAAATAEKTMGIMDVSQRTVEDYMRRFRAARLVHGHTHRPADHLFELDGISAARIVLAAWHENTGEVLVISKDGWMRENVGLGQEGSRWVRA